MRAKEDKFAGMRHRDTTYGHSQGEPDARGFGLTKETPKRDTALESRNLENVRRLRQEKVMPSVPEDKLESYLNNVFGNLQDAADKGDTHGQKQACTVCNRPVSRYADPLNFIQVQNSLLCDECQQRDLSSDLLGHMRD